MASVKEQEPTVDKETEVKEVEKKPEQKPAEAKKSAFSVYVGPSILGCFNHITIFPCNVEEALKRPEVVMAVEKHPEIKDLIVPGEKLHEYNNK